MQTLDFVDWACYLKRFLMPELLRFSFGRVA